MPLLPPMRVIPRQALRGAGVGAALGLFNGARTDDNQENSGFGHYARNALGGAALGSVAGAGVGLAQRPGVIARQGAARAARQEAAVAAQQAAKQQEANVTAQTKRVMRSQAGRTALFGDKIYTGMGFVPAPTAPRRQSAARPAVASDQEAMAVARGARPAKASTPSSSSAGAAEQPPANYEIAQPHGPLERPFQIDGASHLALSPRHRRAYTLPQGPLPQVSPYVLKTGSHTARKLFGG